MHEIDERIYIIHVLYCVPYLLRPGCSPPESPKVPAKASQTWLPRAQSLAVLGQAEVVGIVVVAVRLVAAAVVVAVVDEQGESLQGPLVVVVVAVVAVTVAVAEVASSTSFL